MRLARFATRPLGSTIVSKESMAIVAPLKSVSMEERAAESDVDGDDEAVVRADVKHHGLPAAGGVDGRPLVDRPVLEQLADQRRDHASADAHAPREVGPGDRLVLADEIQHDLPVDVARRRPGCADEAACVDLSH